MGFLKGLELPTQPDPLVAMPRWYRPGEFASESASRPLAPFVVVRGVPRLTIGTAAPETGPRFGPELTDASVYRNAERVA